MGVGGNAGTLTPSVNSADRLPALGKGYAVIVQDSGHAGNGTGAGRLKTPDGKRGTARMVDFLYRAAHSVTVPGKAFTKAYYAAPVQHAYFDGCSTGGRMAMMEAERYPVDFDGIIADDQVCNDLAERAVIVDGSGAWFGHPGRAATLPGGIDPGVSQCGRGYSPNALSASPVA